MKKDTPETLERKLNFYKGLFRRTQKGKSISKHYIKSTIRSLEYRLSKFEKK